MLAGPLTFRGLDDLRHYVQRRICEQHELDVATVQMTERDIVRGSRSCGIQFCLHGPRSVKLIAIWETDRNTVLFYNSAGERIERVRVVLVCQDAA